MKTERVNLRVERDLAKWLKRIAAKQRSTVSHVARQLLYSLFEQGGAAS